ncbi:hypothetical protein GIB67_031693, partial [Kingdonia uniflora]
PETNHRHQTKLRGQISTLQQTSFGHIYIWSKYDKTDSQPTRQSFKNGFTSYSRNPSTLLTQGRSKTRQTTTSSDKTTH